MARFRSLNGQQLGVTETRCSHRRDEAKKFALSSFPSSSFREAEPSSLPKKCSSASDVPSEPGGALPRPAPESQRGFFWEAAAVTQSGRALALWLPEL